ncbi:MAG: hypothetical protein JSU63_07215 [Phycisphaerales bacterium]|nr:MAG: hypothetical protein JSU63_07215 [Phycisphaerales bacterium]
MTKRTPDLRKLARRQRWILWLFLIGVLSQFIPTLPMGQYRMIVFVLLTAAQVVLMLAMLIGVILMLNAQGSHILIIILCSILMVAPCVNMLLLLLINMSVARTLKRAGIRVGLMGVKDEDVERIINPMLCSTCGYNLTGNISGVCPECGTEIEQP